MAVHFSFILIKEKNQYWLPFIMAVILLLAVTDTLNVTAMNWLLAAFGAMYFVSAFLYDRPIVFLLGDVVFSVGISMLLFPT
ncbi:MAG: hypothetical protein WC453_01580 [Patescibacteria group bacterium]